MIGNRDITLFHASGSIVEQSSGEIWNAVCQSVKDALAQAAVSPDRIAGISIGAINGALIAGNAPEARVDKLRAFWERVTARSYWDWGERLFPAKGDAMHQWLNQMSASVSLIGGASGFFKPRFPAP